MDFMFIFGKEIPKKLKWLYELIWSLQGYSKILNFKNIKYLIITNA